jgi:hypothetical protein
MSETAASSDSRAAPVDEGKIRRALISAADERYGSLLIDLLDSIDSRRGAEETQFETAIVVLDCGMNTDQRREMDRRGVRLVEPSWDYDGSFPAPWFKAMTARPHLPKWAPGYDLYLWIDADAWIQEWFSIEMLSHAALKYGFAAVPEGDRAYPELIGPAPDALTGPVIEWRYACLREMFGRAAADKFAGYATINSGVFAARADSPVWSQWADEMGKALSRAKRNRFFADQTSLNFVLLQTPAFARLPALCNWMCNRRLPMLSGDALVEPEYPHAAIGIVHTTGKTKHRRWRLSRLEGGVVYRTLHFADKPSSTP